MKVKNEEALELNPSLGNSCSLIKRDFEKFILGEDHPCIMAKTVFGMDQVVMSSYPELGTEKAARQILQDLENYIETYDFETNDFKTFLAVFPDSPDFSELEFEKKLWQQLKLVHKVDDCDWDPEVSADPESEHFSFSICGKAFYVVGMHPNSSREARKSPYPAMAFNLHWQFEKLREMGSFETVRDKIRERDKALQGDINPMLQDFGANSEARQYSGRKVGEEWKCPFLSSN
ncbi:guanitoxin biosynthesis heme-dependent pre-guanitoxin N-hydroxylase GntA [Pontixanthobacter gangjinensis]|uniref:YqcI/YcgG family protein n=1 Tax=Christiangramia aestuarii TaxID=1028746 RepID=A0A7K1LNF6_9FLAO|nr:guanitoxin biosynthesis heme-dependent pre-guanitoxin N-hydroxylase GntA [Christiangramia aestuarii]MUP42332.1 YqcI/YcgG family protein [Christiangramia aestuarii]